MKEQAASIAKRELGPTATVVERVDEGLIHDTYVVRADGAEYVLQLSGPDEEQRETLARGLGCYRLLADTEIPVPDVVTETVREADGTPYVLVEKLPGSSGKRDISPERARNAGRYLAAIHETRRFERAGWLRFGGVGGAGDVGDAGIGSAGDSGDGGDGGSVGGVSVERFGEGGLAGWRHRKVQDNAEYLQAGGLEAVGREVARLFDRETMERMDRAEHTKRGERTEYEDRRGGEDRQGSEESSERREPFAPVLCHNDFSPDNLLFRRNEVTGVLDFDHAYAGNPHRDVAKAANGFWMHDPGADWDVRETVYEGYRDRAALGESFAATEPRYRVETLAVSVGGMVRMDEFSEREKDFYAERLRKAIELVSRS